ncbi:MAG: SdiA-regulated domain-containing protein [Reichenbachiella sp.]
MRKIRHSIIPLLMIIGIIACNQKEIGFPALEIKGMYQLDSLYGLNFDLSGIAKIEDSVYLVADKEWNKFLYGIAFEDSSFKVTHKKNLNFREKLDLEGIDYCNGTTFLINERQGIIYAYTSDDSLSIINADFDAFNMDPTSWGNIGWEGIASDCGNNLLYIVKERDPRNIVVIDTETKHVKDTFNISEKESNDFSDAKFENGHLYVIERNGNFITKINPESRKVVSKYHFKDVASHSSGKLYGPTEFGMAEALLLTADEIWIGLDNNGLKVTEFGQKTYGLSGKSPVIIKFKRPKDF